MGFCFEAWRGDLFADEVGIKRQENLREGDAEEDGKDQGTDEALPSLQRQGVGVRGLRVEGVLGIRGLE